MTDETIVALGLTSGVLYTLALPLGFWIDGRGRPRLALSVVVVSASAFIALILLLVHAMWRAN